MADCVECGRKIGFLGKGTNGRCVECTDAAIRKSVRDRDEGPKVEQAIRDAAIEAILLTTENGSSIRISKRIEIVTAECAFGMNAFKDLLIGLTNIVGGRSETVQTVMRESRKIVLYELKREALSVGANAVIGVDLDYLEIGSAGANMIILAASGTAVILE